MPFSVWSTWSFTSTRSPGATVTPSMVNSPPAAGLMLAVLATRQGSLEPAKSREVEVAGLAI
jgi:hypothetical protein